MSDDTRVLRNEPILVKNVLTPDIKVGIQSRTCQPKQCSHEFNLVLFSTSSGHSAGNNGGSVEFEKAAGHVKHSTAANTSFSYLFHFYCCAVDIRHFSIAMALAERISTK